MTAKIKKGLAFRRVGEELFVVDSARARLHELNGPAAVIWECLARGLGAAAVAAAMAEEFEVDEKTALADMKRFVLELKSAGLLENEI